MMPMRGIFADCCVRARPGPYCTLSLPHSGWQGPWARPELF